MDEPSQHSGDSARYATLGQLGAEMVGPIVVGLLLDYQFDTMPWITVGGAVFGFVGGMAHMIYVLNRRGKE